MIRWKRRNTVLRVTSLTAALIGVYGVVAAAPVTDPYVCSSGECELGAEPEYIVENTDSSLDTWAVQAENVGTRLTLNSTSVQALGTRNRAVGALAGANVVLRGARVQTNTAEEGNHGVQAHGQGSLVELHSADISTNGRYSRGLLATDIGLVQAEQTRVATQGDHSHAVQAYGAILTPAGPVPSRVTLREGAVQTQGRESYGLYAQSVGSVSVDEVAIDTYGEGGFGAFAFEGGSLDVSVM